MANQRILIDINPKFKLDNTPEQAQHETALLEKLKTLAQQQSIDAQLFICDYRSSIASNLILHPESLEKAVAQIKSEHEKTLKSLSEKFQHDNINYSIKVEWYKPYYEAIIKAAEDFKADLVLKQAHTHSALRNLFITPGDYQLLKSCPSPLLLSKTNNWNKDKCIIAAVDPSHSESENSHLDDIIVQQAKELSEQLNLPLKVCHVFDPTGWEVILNSSATTGVMGQFVVIDSPDDHHALMKKIRKQHETQLNVLKQRHQLKDDEVNLLEGFPEEAITQVADDLNAAFAVVGTTYRSGLLGSTAESLLEQIGCDIIAVKPGDFSSLDTH